MWFPNWLRKKFFFPKEKMWDVFLLFCMGGTSILAIFLLPVIFSPYAEVITPPLIILHFVVPTGILSFMFYYIYTHKVEQPADFFPVRRKDYQYILVHLDDNKKVLGFGAFLWRVPNVTTVALELPKWGVEYFIKGEEFPFVYREAPEHPYQLEGVTVERMYVTFDISTEPTIDEIQKIVDVYVGSPTGKYEVCDILLSRLDYDITNELPNSLLAPLIFIKPKPHWDMMRTIDYHTRRLATENANILANCLVLNDEHYVFDSGFIRQMHFRLEMYAVEPFRKLGRSSHRFTY